MLVYDLRSSKLNASSLISKLASDSEPEIAKAASDAK